MKYVISGFSDEYASGFSEQLKGFNELNIQHLELRFADGVNVADLTDDKTDKIKALLKKAGIKVSAIGSPIGKISLNDDFDEHLKVAERIFKTAVKLNCKFVRIFAFYLNGRTRDESFVAVCERLTKLLEIADKYALTLCLENEAGVFNESPSDCLRLLERFNGKLRAVFDMGNFVLGGYEPYENAYPLLKRHIAYFHIKDATKDGVIVPCGEGAADIERILKDFKNYSDENTVFVSLEPHLTDFKGLSALTAHDLKKTTTFPDEKQAFIYAYTKLSEIIKGIK